MPNVSHTFTAAGEVSDTFFLPKGETATYEVTGTFDATLILERNRGGAAWVPVLTTTDTVAERRLLQPGTYRFRCSVYASGDPTIAIDDVDDILWQVVNPRTGEVVAQLNESGLTVSGFTNEGAETTTGDQIFSANVDIAGILSATLVNLAQETGLTAHAGGGQADALELSATKTLHIVGTCATAADSVKLPTVVADAFHRVINMGAAALQVYGSGTATINGIATGTGISIPVGEGRDFHGGTAGAAGTWRMATAPATFTSGENPTASDATNNTLGGTSAGAALIAGGTGNTLFGKSAGDALTTGDNNVAIGLDALGASTTGGKQVAIGYQAMMAMDTDSSESVAIGAEALKTAASGSYVNVAVGAAALKLATGSNNTAVGWNAGTAVSSGVENSFLGCLAGAAATTPSGLVAIGNSALSLGTTGCTENTAVGWKALRASNADGNTAVGYNAAAAVTGGYNTAVGVRAMEAATSSELCVAIGSYALQNLTTGDHNVGVGNAAGGTNTSGAANTAVGSNALGGAAATAINGNTAVGEGALLVCVANYNTAIGSAALSGVTSGSANIGIGKYAGCTVTTTSHGLYIGDVTQHASDYAIDSVTIASQLAATTGPVWSNRNTFTDRQFTAVPNSAPNSAHITNSTVTWWVDEAGHTLNARLKYADGTVKNITTPIPVS